jgi:hypothetical protein
MSKSMNKANQRIFDKFRKIILDNGEYCEDVKAPRWIHGSADDKKWFLDANIVFCQEIVSKKKIAILTAMGKTFLVTIGFGDINCPSFLNPYDLNAGLYTEILSTIEVNLSPRVSVFDIIDKIMPESISKEGYTGHNLIDLIDIFETINIFEVGRECPFSSIDPFRIFGTYLCVEKSLINLPFTDETINSYEEIILNGASCIPFENVILSICSLHYKDSFLDLYRCIEMLYPLIYVQKLYTELHISGSLLDFLYQIQETLDWNPMENKTLNNIIENTPEADLALLKEAQKEHIGFIEMNLAKWVYSIRNSIVHLRPSQKPAILIDVPWELLLRGMLSVINYWYNKFKDSLI